MGEKVLWKRAHGGQLQHAFTPHVDGATRNFKALCNQKLVYAGDDGWMKKHCKICEKKLAAIPAP